MSKTKFQLPSSVMDVNLKDRLEKYNPKKHLLNVAEETRNYFLKQKNKNAKTHSSPEKLKADKKWVEFGKPSTRYVASYEEVLKIGALILWNKHAVDLNMLTCGGHS